MIEPSIYMALLWVFLAISPVTLISLIFFAAPYGRHMRGGFGPAIPTRAAWVIMESPSVAWFAVVFFSGAHALSLVPLTLFSLWQAHYVQRTLVYPLLTRVDKNRKTPVLIVGSGFCFNILNSTVNGAMLSQFGGHLTSDWLGDPRFLLGALLFVSGYALNRHADAILHRLRKPGEKGYRIPEGGLYRFISCPNYFGEILEWLGWALATWSLAGLAFALFTIANLAPRALKHHRWYHQQFPDYPKNRRALVPFLM